jgi:hypothetical protein
MLPASGGVNSITPLQPCAVGLAALEDVILSGGKPELFLWSREGDAYVLVSLDGDPKMVLLNDRDAP